MRMFIREVRKKNPGSDTIFVYHRLMESVRTPKGPRQRMLLDLGKLDLPQEQWKTLANRIEEIISGQQRLVDLPQPIEDLARQCARRLIRKQMQSAPAPPAQQQVQAAAQWEKVDLNSLSQSEARTIGGEAVGYHAFKELGFPRVLKECGFGEEQIPLVALLVIGRLLHPGSERDTALWAKLISGLGELLGTDFQHLSNNILYRISDLLVEHKENIEKRLAEQERALYCLGEKIILYDLTNTYLTGCAEGSINARHGRSKQKRSDCPLLTLALVIDEDGFPKASKVFAGNVSEPATLKSILSELRQEKEKNPQGQLALFQKTPPTVVIDAGIATQKNLDLISQENYHYICVSRTRPKEVPEEGLIIIKEDASSTIQVKRLDQEGEVFLYCQSSGRAKKEEAIKALFQQRLEEGLKAIADSLTKKGGTKSYEKVMERVGRLKEKYSLISQFYTIDMQKDNKNRVTHIRWSIEDKQKVTNRFCGSYFIRTSRKDLDEKQMWSLYISLTQLEDAFRSLKAELGLRPVYHQKDSRMEGHLFITVLAYHLLAAIRRQLKNKGISYRWDTIREQLATQIRITTSITNDQGDRIHIRQTTEPEPFHQHIYRALGLPLKPLRTKRLKV
jgi:transposase